MLLLFIGIKTVRDADPNFEKLARGLLYAAPPPSIALTYAPPAAPVAPPQFFQSVAPVSASLAKPAIPAIEKQAGHLEDLRETVHSVSRAYRNSSVATAQPMLGASPRSPQKSIDIQAFSAIY